MQVRHRPARAHNRKVKVIPAQAMKAFEVAVW